MALGKVEEQMKSEQALNGNNGVLPDSAGSVGASADTAGSGLCRRTFLQRSGVMAAGSMLGGGLATFGIPAVAASDTAVNIGFIEDISGNIAIYGIQKYHCAQLAVAEINQGLTLAGGPVGVGGINSEGKSAKDAPTLKLDTKSAEIKFLSDGGASENRPSLYRSESEILIPSGDKGLLGKEVKLAFADGQSNNRIWQQLARKLIQQDKVDALVAGFTSAEREAIRPIVDKGKQLYFYTNQYEGGVADEFTFCTGPVCEQQVVPVVQYMVSKFGPRFYTLAADYNFGQLTAGWAKAVAPLVGGEVIGEEFLPMDQSQFSQVIAKVQQAKPDCVFALLVSENLANYYPQAAAAGLKFPMASTINMMQGYEHIRFAPPAMENMHNAVHYMAELPTERNQAFLKRFFKMFPNDPYVGGMAQNTYFTIHLYAKAVRVAGTTDQAEVKKVLESGWTIEAPEGSVSLDPATHHCARAIRMARADKDQNISFVREWPNIDPWWLSRLGVNLVRNPEHKQYTPGDDPFFPMLAKMTKKK
jgi:branched-chain amino acid transport system substrate-binding protein